MANINDNLNNLLELQPDNIEDELAIIDVTSKTDSDFARENIRELILKGNKLFDDVANVARESENPTAFDSASKLLKNLSDLNKDLMEIQKRKKELLVIENKTQTANGEMIVDKAVIFTGSTAELLRVIRENK